MKRGLLTGVTAAALCVVIAGTPGASGVAAGPAAPAGSFAFAIGNGHLNGRPAAVADRLGAFDLVVVDGEEARAAEVDALHGQGTTVLGYLSVGTIERWRSWYRRIRRYRLGASAHWKDEWYADVAQGGYRRRIAREIAPRLLDKGFDGLFLDNVDMVETRRHREHRHGMAQLVGLLDGLVSQDGRFLFAQNGHDILDRLGIAARLDGWNREDVTWTYDFGRRRYVRRAAGATRRALAELRDFAARGLTVTATDYTRAADEEALQESVANACSAGALRYVGDIGLTARRLPSPPLTCP